MLHSPPSTFSSRNNGRCVETVFSLWWAVDAENHSSSECRLLGGGAGAGRWRCVADACGEPAASWWPPFYSLRVGSCLLRLMCAEVTYGTTDIQRQLLDFAARSWVRIKGGGGREGLG